jgi:hypothetical protein
MHEKKNAKNKRKRYLKKKSCASNKMKDLDKLENKQNSQGYMFLLMYIKIIYMIIYMYEAHENIPNHEEPFEGQDLVKEKLREPV